MVTVARFGRRLEHWDVKTAFLTTHMDCVIDVTLPEAFNQDAALQQEARRSTQQKDAPLAANSRIWLPLTKAGNESLPS